MSWETYGAAANPGGENALARSEDINDGTVVGERSTSIRGGRSTNSADGGLGSRANVGSVLVLVSSGDGKEDVVVNETASSAVERGRVATAKGHVGESTVGAATRASVADDVVETSNDARDGARAAVTEDLDAEESGALGDTVGVGADGAGDVSAVAVAVGVAALVGDELLSAAAEVLQYRVS